MDPAGKGRFAHSCNAPNIRPGVELLGCVRVHRQVSLEIDRIDIARPPIVSYGGYEAQHVLHNGDFPRVVQAVEPQALGVWLGRREEVAVIDLLLEAARRQRSSATLIVHGEPGVGKTSLLEHAVGRARDFALLRVQPLEAETALPFAGLFGLLRPILPLLTEIPDPQRAALSGALALGPPAPGDRFAVAAATLTMLAAAAEERPLLVLVDDAHWLDQPSREALLFAGRRLGSEGIVLLLGMRERDWLHQAGVDTLELGGLAPDDAAALVDAAHRSVDAGVRSRLVAETNGNPLAILQALHSLGEDELRGAAPITHPLPVGPALETAFALELEHLPRDTRTALLIAAASETGILGEVLSALAVSGLDAAALDAAERAGVIMLTREHVEFRHPLVRAAAYHGQSPADRRAAHAALASALGDGERAVWHHAAATVGPNESVAARLERAGATAMSRSAYAAAASAMEAAAALSINDQDRLRRSIGGARALWLSGDARRAATVLGNLVELIPEPRLRADVRTLQGAAMIFTRPVAETYAMLVDEAERVAPHDPQRAAAMLANAALTRFMAADHEAAARTAAQALQRLDAPGDPSAMLATSMLASARAISGEVDAALELISPLLASVDSIDPLGELAFTLGALCGLLVWTEQWLPARALFERLVSAARSAGAPTMLPFPLSLQADLELRTGRIAAAYAAAAESVELATVTGLHVEASFAWVTLARVEAILGRDDDCRAHATAAIESSRRSGADSIAMFATATLGFLELSLGAADRAALHLAECARLEEQHGPRLPTIHQSAADHIEALARIGARGQAEQLLAELELRGRQSGLRWPLAGAARCRGWLAHEGEYEGEFETALRLFGEEMTFERARTQLSLGMRLRRSRRRAAARSVLHEALSYFRAAGAEPWAEQARAELRASGESPPRMAGGLPQSLTPQELQVALVVANGATNKEAAAALFLSAKTIEFHLGNIYRKLHIRSRAELVRRVEGLP